MFLSAHKYTVVFMKIKFYSLKYNFISRNWTKVEHHLKRLVSSIVLTTDMSFSNLITKKSMQRRKEMEDAVFRVLNAKFATSFRASSWEVVFLLKAGQQCQYIHGKYIKKKKKRAFTSS